MKLRLLKYFVFILLVGACSDDEGFVMMRVINGSDRTLDRIELFSEESNLLFTPLASEDTSNYWNYPSKTHGIPPFFLVVGSDTVYSFTYVFGPVIFTAPPSPLPAGRYTYEITFDVDSLPTYYRLQPVE